MAIKKRKDEIEIDLLAIIKLLWKNALIILLAATSFCAATLGCLVFLVTPKYDAEASMYVNNSSFSFGQQNFSISLSELSASSSLSRTYIYILETRETIEEVIRQAGLNYSYEDMMKKLKMVTSEEITGTAIFKVKVRSTSPTEAELIANTIVKVLPSRIEEIVDGSTLRTVSYAIVPSHRASPKYTLLSALGFFLGAAISSAWIIIHDLENKRSNDMIGSAEDLRRRYPDIAVLSLIPDMRLSSRKGYYYSSYYGTNGKARKNK